MLYYITGGERSGKSAYAQNLALQLSENPIYLATSRIWDEDFGQRVQRHQEERDSRWSNLEAEKELALPELKNRVVVIDCVTLWLTNFFTDTQNNRDESLRLAKESLNRLLKIDATFIIISNEIGMGLHAQTHVGRKFTELQGWMNQYIAAKADYAVFMVSGLPLELKSQDKERQHV
ncbi:bifunctional adenosylcobinamide kinase/adenosylcobinamide-phosphate guanylyltransferase [Xanthovirga aplysinae]|uniref:bifunctional adenosylcobinamide kinase/adenosylcobinamide-phosphate guanylyltransferase n=1 Tax=Xanthovirga aplysinae TaxID=2529853 RepID=UPI0012BCA758|nr:bifunctional adenosylcobinamide kinase/adenosylcobinamide-phosphate guanylyltransferase [Xanthovirga aplysinae]MTI31003.1 bifunctional adenosylcobinamide kinase/adenosylcobinamide-phosphate guanylyltransferase [Xanthovirga aplysinae]